MTTRHFEYVIVGAGMAADAAARGIRQEDPQGSILMIGAEEAAPYNRPPLTKGLWKKKKVEQIWRHTENLGVELRLGHKVQSVDPAARIVRDEDGEFEYQKLLLATGATPIHMSENIGEVIYYRNLADYTLLREQTEQFDNFIVIGGGYIGSEIAAALNMHGKQVTILFPEEGLCQRIFPLDMSKKVSQDYQEKGVRVVSQRLVQEIGRQGDHLYAVTDQGERYEADSIIAGLGVKPDLTLANQIGLKTGKGIQVDANLETSQPGIYAAGDVIEFFNPALKQFMHVEHEDNANKSGEYAGLAMAGKPKPYHYLPMFYSDLFDLGYEAVGLVNSNNAIIGDWEEPYKKGVVYYLRDKKVVGVLLVDTWGKVDAARALIETGEVIPPQELLGKIR